MNVMLLFALGAWLTCVMSLSPPVLTSYSVDYTFQGSTLFCTSYADGENERYRDQFKGYNTSIWLVNFPQQYALSVDELFESCNTTCYKKSGSCGNNPPAGCGLFPEDFFGVQSFFPNTTLVGECPGGSNMWNWTFMPNMNLNYVSKIFTICDSVCTTLIFKNFELGEPSDSLFEPPSYCPCSNSSIVRPSSKPTPRWTHDILRVSMQHHNPCNIMIHATSQSMHHHNPCNITIYHRSRYHNSIVTDLLSPRLIPRPCQI